MGQTPTSGFGANVPRIPGMKLATLKKKLSKLKAKADALRAKIEVRRKQRVRKKR